MMAILFKLVVTLTFVWLVGRWLKGMFDKVDALPPAAPGVDRRKAGDRRHDEKRWRQP